ncbi:MAG: TolC family protein [Dysgonomonas mossii]|uniref:TolC family protein n=1 Tax=Dysgonomonas mossii TaxID=163665 RepID=UPI003996B47B
MKKLIISLLFTALVFPVMAQNEVETVLKQIEENSTTLNAMREQMEADKLNNRTGIYLPNPEVEFNYLWGSPSVIGDRKDFNVTQSFDFATVFGQRSKLSKLQNVNVEIQYKSERINLLLRAKEILIELAYYNALAKEFRVRLTNAERIAETYQVRFDKGDANILENNKAQLNLTTVRNEMSRIEIEQNSLLSELKALNGGIDIAFSSTDLASEALASNFNDWYAVTETKSPVLQYVSGQIDISRQQVKLNRAAGLPKLTAGYMSEKVAGERFQGVTVGVSIPLWENKNRIKQAKAQVRAAETALEDTKTQFYNRLQNLYMRSSGLQANALKYRQALSSYNNESLLKKALDAGEISLLNYLLEIEYYYDAMNKVLEAEKDFSLSMAELSAVEL